MSSNIPNEYLCPISQTIMKDPVSLSICGHTFERENLESWINQNATCPTCRSDTLHQTLTSNWTLKSLIDKLNNPNIETKAAEISLNDIEMTLDAVPKTLNNISGSIHLDQSEINLSLTVEETDKRRPVSFVCLIDVSGSMGSIVGNGEGGKAFTRLDLVKHVLNVIIASLTETDYMSLVTFSNTAEVVLELKNMSEANKNLAKNCVRILEPQSNTHTGPGLKRAYEIIEKSPINHMKSIILLTDGQDTDGDEILERTFDRIKKPDQVKLNTFGFSNDIYSHTLQMLANKGGGIFGFIPDQSMIGTIFINFMANTYRTFAQDVLIELNDDFEFTYGGGKTKRATLQYGRAHHFLIKKNSEKALNVKIGLTNDSMIELKLNESNNVDDFKVQKARHKMLELLENPALPKISLPNYEKSNELNVPEFLAELKDPGTKDPNNEQIKLSINNWGTWGAHYIRSFRYAHIYEQAINFKSPSMKFYRTPKFDEIVGNLTDIFITLPPPKPSGIAYDNKAPTINMTYMMNRNNGCILSTCKVKLESGEFKQISELKKGDILEGGSKVVCLINSKYNGVLVKINDLQITPYHPVNFNGRWQFPMEIDNSFTTLIENKKSLSVCNLVLDQEHVVNVEGIKCVTLGHGFENDSVLRHPYYGTAECIKDLSKLKGWNEGNISLSNFKSIRYENGLVRGTMDHEY